MCGWVRPGRGRCPWVWWSAYREGELYVAAGRLAHARDPFAVILFDADTGEGFTYYAWERLMSKLIERLIEEKQADTGKSIVAHDDDLSDLAPLVHELCTTAIRKKGRKYDPAGVFIYASQGSWYAQVTSKSLDFRRRGEGGTIREALADLEKRMGKMGEESVRNGKRSRKEPNPEA